MRLTGFQRRLIGKPKEHYRQTQKITGTQKKTMGSHRMKFQSQASVSLRKASVSHGDPLGLSVSLRKASVNHRGPVGLWQTIGIRWEHLAKP